MTFVVDASQLRAFHTNGHTPVWLEAGTHGGQAVGRLVDMDGSFVRLTSAELHKLQSEIAAIDAEAEAAKYAAIAPYLERPRETAADPLPQTGQPELAAAMECFVHEDGKLKKVQAPPQE